MARRRRTTTYTSHRPSRQDALAPARSVVDVSGPSAGKNGPMGPATGPGAPPPMPGAVYDSVYNNDLAGAQAQYDTSLAGINLQRSRVGFDTGFGADGQVDLSNPYSQAMLLDRTAKQAMQGTTNSLASQGQLYSGAHRRGLAEVGFQYERSRSDLRTGASRAYEDLNLDEQGAANQRTNAGYGASADQAERWKQMQRDWFETYG